MKEQDRKRLKRSLFGFSIIITFCFIFSNTEVYQRLEQFSLDYRYQQINRQAHPSDQIVLIDIDENTLKKWGGVYGRWPWPRKVYKDMIEFLMVGEPSAIIFDMLFTESQVGTDDDQLFAEATANAGIVSHAVQFLPESGIEGKDHIPIENKIDKKYHLTFIGDIPYNYKNPMEYHDYILPVDRIRQVTPWLHSTNAAVDNDGLLRRLPLIQKYDDVWLPSLATRALMSKLTEPKFSYRPGYLTIYEKDQVKWQIPLGQDNTYQLHFYSKGFEPTTYRLGEVLDSAQKMQTGEVSEPELLSVNPLNLKGKMILIGASATGLADLKPTPVSKYYPGVLLHTTAMSNILKSDYLKQAPKFQLWFACLFFMLSCYIGILFIKNFYLKLAVPLILLSLHIIAVIFAFQKMNYHIQFILPTMAILLTMADAFIYMTFVEGKEKKKLTGTLSKYLSPQVTEYLVENGINPSAEVGHHQELTILFSDVRGFTTMSEKLPAADVVRILNQYLGVMTDLIFAQKGTLDKFIGDAIMAFWGAPVKNENHAIDAVDTAIQMLEKLKLLNLDLNNQGHDSLKIGIGIQTGDVIVGNIGSEKRLDYTVIGDNVNTASRFEGLTKQYGVEILIGENTYQLVKDKYLCRILDLVQAKGKSNAVRVYEPICSMSDQRLDQKQNYVHEYNQAWQLYAEGRFIEASAKFQWLLQFEEYNSGPVKMYIDRCEELKNQNIDHWEGVYVAKSK